MKGQHDTGCPYCGATGDESLADYLAKVARCHNCQIDIALRGEWTGQGWARWQRIQARYPEAAARLIGKVLARRGASRARRRRGRRGGDE